MRVLITSDTVGGVWSYTRELVSGLLAEKTSVVLVTLGRLLNEEQASWAESIATQYPQSFILVPTAHRLEWMENAGQDIEASCNFVQSLAREYRPDLLHTNQFCFAALDLPIPKILVAHSDVHSWWRAVHGVPPPDTNWLRRYTGIVRGGVHGATVVVAPTQWMLDQIEEIYGAMAHSQVIYNGCSPKQFQANMPKQLQAVSLGRLWDEGKNIRLLEQVQSSIPILIAGDTHPPEGSTSTAFSAPVHSGLRHIGTLNESEVRKLLANSAIYIATSRYEPFGLAPVEAAFSGCAIVTNDIPPLREVWGNDALYYERDNASSLTTCLDALAGDPVLLRKMATSANRRAHVRFSVSTMTSTYLDLYNNVLQWDCLTAHA